MTIPIVEGFCGEISCFQVKAKTETFLLGVANLLFLAGAIYILHNSGLSGISLLASVDFWGLAIPVSIFTLVFFSSLYGSNPG